MIQNIPIDEIATHPKNLRKDLGDLTELTESIKNVGILQNLTIIPCFQVKETILNENIKYYALIGNRRLSAAKLVGLLEVPCIIADINESEQVATMLLENMQRSDLTVYEQAQGVQMMLDLGEDMATIANKTGFSESTIRRRVKLLDLDKEKFKAAEDRGATLADYAELEKIEDINVKNKVLESIGTHNFKWELNKAIEDEENKKKKQRILKLVEYYALKVDTTEGYIKKHLSIYDEKSFEMPEDINETEYFYFVDDFNNVYLLTEAEETKENINIESEEEIANREKKKKLNLKIEKLEVASKLAYNLRFEFIKNWNSKKPEHKETVILTAINVMLKNSYSFVNLQTLGRLLNTSFYNENGQIKDIDKLFYTPEIKKAFENNRYHTLLMVCYSLIDNSQWAYYSSSGKYESHKFLDNVYNVLTSLGYEMSSEEKALKDGTHELYNKEN